ncbi:hypothetical protein I5J50_gp68 [Mycobacterium phage Purky]|uniref:Phage Gp37/Gp68 family protein n=1 Tax=Mycobacterium phage Purky TaxID=2593351 RepID=A0A514TWU3_9CAUD|nr:hypothetical protein I5J50_gp68 [Mycobacterium phage Purky]QDK01171.1 hypothetical protein SEA_PURKY_68 [Mycobacterium phage Purky]
MADNTSIEWTRSDDGSPGATWNPVTGCTKVSAGCDNCYAEKIANRFAGTSAYPNGFEVTLRPERLDQPLRWKRPRRIFVNSMSDLFHDQVPDDYIAKVWAVMAWTPHHTYQVLTKRHARMRTLISSREFLSLVDDQWYFIGREHQLAMKFLDASHPYDRWPLPNVWLGVSTENQKWADIRIPALLDTPAAVRFISAEPLLGPLDLSRYLTGDCPLCGDDITESPCGVTHANMACDPTAAGLDWVIVGGESGPGARPMEFGWASSLLDQCLDAKVPFLFKQWGNWTSDTGRVQQLGYDRKKPHAYVNHADGTVVRDASEIRGGSWSWVWNVGKAKAGRELLGRTWDQYPEVSRG